jgi:glucokinase
MSNENSMRIGIDIGGTKIAAGIIQEDGRILRQKKVRTDVQEGYPAVRNQIDVLVRALLLEEGAEPASIKKIGIACAGQIEQETQKVLFSPNLNWKDVPLKQDIEQVTGIPTSVDNDVNAGTYGEWKFGLNGECSNVIGIFIGTGIGGGLILNGGLYRGAHGVAGEIGHMTLNPYGYTCHCGNRGCFEAYCGGIYIENRVRESLRQGYRGKLWDSIGGDVSGLNAGHVEQGYLMGDELCKKVWEEIVEYLGSALQSIANLLNPELIILGGGVVAGTKLLVDGARAVMMRRALQASMSCLRIERAKMGEDATLLGAAFLMDK